MQAGAAIPVDTIRRDEVNAVLANQRELVTAARDIKNFVTDIHSKVTNIQAAQQRGQGSVQQVGGPGAQPDLLPMVSEIRESLNNVRRELTNSYARQQQGGGAAAAKDCPTPTCVTGLTVALLLGGQLILLLGYLMYRDSREASAKKFY